MENKTLNLPRWVVKILNQTELLPWQKMTEWLVGGLANTPTSLSAKQF